MYNVRGERIGRKRMKIRNGMKKLSVMKIMEESRERKRNKKSKRKGALCLAVLCALLSAGCGSRDPETVRVGSLKGPTSMGILFLMDRAEKGETEDSYEFHMAVGADELLALMAKDELDIALVPANVAAVFYQKTEGGVAVIDINTLGVLSVVTGAGDIARVSDLKGKTICLTGKGATPDACLQYILEQNGLAKEDYALEYKSEATEVAVLLAEDPEKAGLLPQPFATAALMQNPELETVLLLNEEWEKLEGAGGSGMVTGVTIVRRAFLQEHEEAVEEFLKEHRESTKSVNRDPRTGAGLAVSAGIVAKEEIALQAIPLCNITCITGKEMREKLEGYLKVLADFRPELTGGSLPGEDFYFLGQ